MPEQIDGFYQKVDAFGRKGIALEGERFRVLKQNAAIKRKNVAAAKVVADKAAAAKVVADKAAADKAAADKAAAAKVVAKPLIPLIPEPNVYFFKPQAVEALGATQALLGKIFDDGVQQAAFKDPAFRAQRRGEFDSYVEALVRDPQTQQNLKKEWEDIDHDQGKGAEYECGSFLLDRLMRVLRLAEASGAPVLSRSLAKTSELIKEGLEDLNHDRMLVGQREKKKLFARLFADKVKVQQAGLTGPQLIKDGTLTAAEIAAPWTLEPEKLRGVLEKFQGAGLVTPQLAQEIEQKMQQDLDWRCGYGHWGRMLKALFNQYSPFEHPDHLSFAKFLVPLYVATHPEDVAAAQHFIRKVQREGVELPPGLRLSKDRMRIDMY